jgi:gamma-glutamyl:cysteine ligase YbdK (ATP-grasp superfamily)
LINPLAFGYGLNKRDVATAVNQTTEMDAVPSLHLFDAFGIELEYMIVDAETLDVRPIADELFRSVTGAYVSDVERGPITWSNELVAHVVELKTTTPAPSLDGLAELFQEEVREINRRLAAFGARLLPTAMHPWMDPHREMRLWPHESTEIYEAFNRVFDCRGHGWANLQSMHINLPFCGDEEFGRLHAAVRLLLPLLPAIAASSPVMDGRLTGLMDNRLDVYRRNSARIPSVAGRIIPERAFTRADYERLILQPMYDDIRPYDPAGLLQDEYLNSRGAIVRFSRGSIEIRLLDVQECPAADLAIAGIVIDVLKQLVAETWTDVATQQSVEIEPLERVLLATIRDAERAVVDDAAVLAQFGMVGVRPMTAGELWEHLGRANDPLRTEGETLASTIARSVAPAATEGVRSLYRELSVCLEEGRRLVAGKQTP